MRQHFDVILTKILNDFFKHNKRLMTTETKMTYFVYKYWPTIIQPRMNRLSHPKFVRVPHTNTNQVPTCYIFVHRNCLNLYKSKNKYHNTSSMHELSPSNKKNQNQSNKEKLSCTNQVSARRYWIHAHFNEMTKK